jgi:hypothetical protein
MINESPLLTDIEKFPSKSVVVPFLDPSTSIEAPGNTCPVSASVTEPDTLMTCANVVTLQHNDIM